MKFSIGARVRGNEWKTASAISSDKYERGWHEGFLLRYEGRPGDSWYVAHLKGPDKEYCVWAKSLEGLDKPLGIKSPVRQRCGRPATILTVSKDPDRPILAAITMADGSTRELSYSEYGHFYKCDELPVDLVAV